MAQRQAECWAIADISMIATTSIHCLGASLELVSAYETYPPLSFSLYGLFSGAPRAQKS